jgi:hypothetical protein
MLIILAGGLQFARVFYTYHALQKAMRGGASLLARSANVNYCDPGDASLLSAKNFIVYGNLQGLGTPVMQTVLCDGSCLENLIQILPERQDANSTTVNACPCGTNTTDDCDVSTTGRPPDFIVVNLTGGYPLQLSFAFVTLPGINLNVSVRMPVTGG